MKSKILGIFVALILLIPIVSNAFTVTEVPDEVESGATFNYDISTDEKIYLANGHLKFNSNLFKYVSCNTANVEVEQIADNEIYWIYTDLSDNPAGINQIEFVFQAVSVIKDVWDNFDTTKAIYINLDESTYEPVDSSHKVTIKAKNTIALPLTGGIGIWIFIVIGLILIIIAILLMKKRKKEKAEEEDKK